MFPLSAQYKANLLDAASHQLLKHDEDEGANYTFRTWDREEVLL